MFVFAFHMLGTACNRVLRLRLGLGRVEQAGACTSLWRCQAGGQWNYFRREYRERERGGVNLRRPSGCSWED